MTLTLTDDRDAFLAVLALVIGADQQGSLRERDYLHNEVRALPLFAGLSTGDFTALLGDVTERLYTAVPLQDGGFAPAGTGSVLAQAKEVLGPDLCRSAVESAAGLCAADDTAAAETALLAQIRAALA
jgi:hypothetical protein